MIVPVEDQWVTRARLSDECCGPQWSQLPGHISTQEECGAAPPSVGGACRRADPVPRRRASTRPSIRGATPLRGQCAPSAQDTLADTTASVRLREKPAPTARALALLRQGSPVRLYECSEGWCSVAVSKLAGYVLEEFLTTQAPQATAQGRGYVNSQGEWVSSPTWTADGQPPAGASAKCRDGTFSFRSRSGTCSHHGGVAEWL